LGSLFEAGLLLLSPFFLVGQAIFSALFTYFFARLLIHDRQTAPEPVTFTATMRIQAVAMLSNWYSIVPIFGGLLAFVTGLILTVTGVRERFGVSTRRAMAVVLSPYLLVAGLFFLLVALLAVVAVQLPLGEWIGNFDPAKLGF
jgi:hypothetical protein